jgi:hypothetical protein
MVDDILPDLGQFLGLAVQCGNVEIRCSLSPYPFLLAFCAERGM